MAFCYFFLLPYDFRTPAWRYSVKLGVLDIPQQSAGFVNLRRQVPGLWDFEEQPENLFGTKNKNCG